jgi:hypothetical protein
MTASMPEGIIKKRRSGRPGRTRVNSRPNGQKLEGVPDINLVTGEPARLLEDFASEFPGISV